MYDILIIAGPSASGKTTVAEELLKRTDRRFELVRSLTTRDRRGDGFDDEYLYASREEFEEALKNDGVLEHTEYAGAFYGTPKSEIERISSEGKFPLLILDLNGVRALSSRTDILNTCSIYIYCDFPTLEKRLTCRYLCGDFTEECKSRFTKRMSQNKKDIEEIFDHAKMFYALVENSGCLESSADEILMRFDEFLLGKPKDMEAHLSVCKKIISSLNETKSEENI